MSEKKAIKEVRLDGETVTTTLFVDGLGGQQMFWIFESGRAIMMPINGGCPVQEGTLDELREQLDRLISYAEKQKDDNARELDDRIIEMKRLKGGIQYS